VFLRVLQNHPDRPLTHFPWETRQFVHDPIHLNDGVSSKPGAIYIVNFTITSQSDEKGAAAITATP